MTTPMNPPMLPAAGAPPSTPPNGTPPVQPPAGGAPPTAPNAQAFANLDHLVELSLPEGKRIVPLRAIIPEVQLNRAGQAALQEARRILNENSANAAAAERWNTLQVQLARNPQAAVEGIQRLANLANGQSGTPAPARGGAPAGDTEDAPDPRSQDHEQRLRNLEVRESQNALQTEIDAVFALYPVLASSPEIKTAAQMAMAAARVQNPNVPLERVAASFYTGIAQIAGGSLTDTRDTRLQRIEGMPPTPAASGAPTVQEFKAPTAAVLRNGQFERDGRALWERFQSAMQPK